MTLTTRHLKRGDKIRLTGLGILQVRKRAARMGRNPATGAPIKVKASTGTVKLFGRRPRNKARQWVLKRLGSNTLGSLDRALLYVWQEAVADRIVRCGLRDVGDRMPRRRKRWRELGFAGMAGGGDWAC